MKLRPPAVPLITVDPYFSVWSDSDRLYERDTVHWTCQPNTIAGTVKVDGTTYRFMSSETAVPFPALTQTGLEVDSFSSTYTFVGAGIRLTARFLSPLLPDNLDIMTRPVSYLELSYFAVDGREHEVSAKIELSEQLCLDYAGQSPVAAETIKHGGLTSVKMGNSVQKILAQDGDDLRIDWGYVYVSVKNPSAAGIGKIGEMSTIYVEKKLDPSALFTFAYDDVKSIEYFGRHLSSLWNRDGMTIAQAIESAHADYETLSEKCRVFDERLFIDAVRAGGEKYAELLQLAVRQTVSSHKAVLDENGEILFISKECHSNGCAATVDVSYPSIPFFLLYNPELVRGMMRPIYKYAARPEWTYDFAPHDVGRYPKLNGQVYGLDLSKSATPALDKQMPVEECGNMLIMEAAAAVASRDASFAASHMDILEKWVVYLTENGDDPQNQLCTDDFAGHLAHNCNLSLKAIMGIECMAILCRMTGRDEQAQKYTETARAMARRWMVNAAEGDGSYRLAFDQPGTFSMKYNIVWDKLFGTKIMPPEMFGTEILSYRAKAHPYGLPLDSRKPYTKSDWLVWTATLSPDRESFEELVEPLWTMYNLTSSRVPMTDWYYTITGLHKSYISRRYTSRDAELPKIEKSFRNRSVIGGLFIKLLEFSGKMKI